MVDRTQALGFRGRAQQLDRTDGTVADTAVSDIGMQDSGLWGAVQPLAKVDFTR
jgi:hypothetical protein